jgi:hypothetical protein
VQRACEGDVVDIVTGVFRERPKLAPPSHARVDQPRVPRQAHIRPDSQPLSHSGTQPLKDYVGMIDQGERRLEIFPVLEVKRDRPPAAKHSIYGAVRRKAESADSGGPVDTDDLRAKVGEDHGGVRRRPDRG